MQAAKGTDMRDSALAGFAIRLRAVRSGYGAAIGEPELGVAEFARKIGVREADYLDYESGVREPGLAFLATLHQRTGVSLDWLLVEEEAQDTARPSAA